MKIAFDARYVGKSGIGTFSYGILSNLVTQNPKDSFLIIKNYTQKFTLGSNVKFLETDITPFSSNEFFAFPCKEINSCDAYFSPYINIPSGIKVPIYSTIHDTIFFDVKGLTSSIGRFARYIMYERCIRLSDAIFTVSEFSKDRIRYHFHTKKDIEIVYNGITDKLKYFSINNVSKKDYLIYVGNIKQHKGIDLLLKAYSKARSMGLKSKLFIVGEYSNFRSSANLSGLLDDTRNIKFTGHVSDEELYDLVSSAKCLVLPSRYEGFGIPPLEALYLGTNAIVSDIPALKEIYADLPVCFFKSDSIDGLVEALISNQPTFDLEKTRSYIDSMYNFKISAQQIMNFIKNSHY